MDESTASSALGLTSAAHAVLDGLRTPVLLVDAALVITGGSAAATDLLGSRDLVGRPLAALLTLQARTLDTGPSGEAAWDARAFVTGDDRRLPVHLEAGPLRSAGRFAGWVVALTPTPATSAAADLSTQLAEALRGDEIVLHYQPIVRLQDRRPVAAEALVRWEHPQRGLLTPADFLATADTAALAGPLGMRVLRQACHAAAAWARGVRTRNAVQVAVNLSERQLLQPGSTAFVRAALAVADCPAERLVLEVPESALLRDPEAALHALSTLKDIGVDLAVDDLGTGSSPLSYLKRFPIDLVKIDRSLIAGLGHDPEQSAVVASLVSLAQAMDVRCVAEGVETADQLEVLTRLGCELGQGYLFSRAMNGGAAAAWLARALSPRPAGRRKAASLPSETVARVLELQADGASLHTVAARLNAEGHRNTGGRRWHHTSVAQLIAAHRYPDLGV